MNLSSLEDINGKCSTVYYKLKLELEMFASFVNFAMSQIDNISQRAITEDAFFESNTGIRHSSIPKPKIGH